VLIGELSRRVGIAPSAIRFYEQERLIPRATRQSGRRVFDDRSHARLIVIQLAKDAGFTLAEVRQLVTEFGENRWRRLATRKRAEIQEATERLRTMTLLLEKLLQCKCPDMDYCGRVLARIYDGKIGRSPSKGEHDARDSTRLRVLRSRPSARFRRRADLLV
jgi:MerR family redox-sensitive transcriptional activator SoxR